MHNFRLILSKKHGKIAMFLHDRTHKVHTYIVLALGRIFTHAGFVSQRVSHSSISLVSPGGPVVDR